MLATRLDVSVGKNSEPTEGKGLKASTAFGILFCLGGSLGHNFVCLLVWNELDDNEHTPRFIVYSIKMNVAT